MARKYYPYPVDKQPLAVQDYVRKHWSANNRGEEGLLEYGDRARAAIAAGRPTHHQMTAAKGRLKRGWTNSKKNALSPKNIRKAAKKGGVKGARQAILRTHAVKFGADPYHK